MSIVIIGLLCIIGILILLILAYNTAYNDLKLRPFSIAQEEEKQRPSSLEFNTSHIVGYNIFHDRVLDQGSLTLHCKLDQSNSTEIICNER